MLKNQCWVWFLCCSKIWLKNQYSENLKGMVAWVNQNLLEKDQVKNILMSHQIFLREGIHRLLSIPSLRKIEREDACQCDPNCNRQCSKLQGSWRLVNAKEAKAILDTL